VAGFGQHTRIRARPGKHPELLAKFVEAAEMQQDNPACELTLVSTSPEDPDVVFLTEVWTSAEEHERARTSAEVQAWAKDMPELVDGPPDTTRLDPAVIR
jgi:quinol monooxygenase YgiN